MAELTFKSAGVGIREIDLSQTSTLNPSGTPACVVGTSTRGPAFVPITVGSFETFREIFGDPEDTSYGAFAAKQWLNNSDSLTFVRVLGVGDGSSGTDAPPNSGFIVGEELPQDPGTVGSHWAEGANPNAVAAGENGRTYMLGAFMKDSDGSTYLKDAGVSNVYPLTAATDGTITIVNPPSAADTVKLIATDGTTEEFTMAEAGLSETNTNDDNAIALATYITGLDDFTATHPTTDVVNIEQNTIGADGNTAITIVNKQTMHGSDEIFTLGADTIAATATIKFNETPGDDATITFGGAFTIEFSSTGVFTSTADVDVNTSAPSENGAVQFKAAVDSEGTYETTTVVDNDDGTYSIDISLATPAGLADNVPISYDDDDTSSSVFAGSDVEFTGGTDAVAASATLTVDNLPIDGETLIIEVLDAEDGSTVTAITMTVDTSTSISNATTIGTATAGTVSLVLAEIQIAIDANDDISAVVDVTDVVATMAFGGDGGNTAITLPTSSIMTSSDFTNGEDSGKAAPIVRGILMTPNGVLATLKKSSSDTILDTTTEATVANLSAKSVFGQSDASGWNKFTLQLNGFTINADSAFELAREYELSLDPDSDAYITDVLNTDPLLLEEFGHYLHSDYKIDGSQAKVSADGLSLEDDTDGDGVTIYNDIFLVPSQESGEGPGSSYDDFSGRFDHAITPWVKSQFFGSTEYNLFRFHALTDGEGESNRFKIEISGITPPANPGEYPTFNVQVRKFESEGDRTPVDMSLAGVTTFTGVSLDPTASNYIAKIIGDKNVYYDLEKATQQLADEGSYNNRSTVIRVEVADKVAAATVPVLTYPMGHRGYNKLVTGKTLEADYSGGTDLTTGDTNLSGATFPPVPMRQHVNIISSTSTDHATSLRWGTQYSEISSAANPNGTTVSSDMVNNIAKYLPTALLTSNDGDFSLENIVLTEDSDGDFVDWTTAVYDRQRDSEPTGTKRYLIVDDLSDAYIRNTARFSFISQGGNNGTNIFVEEKSKFLNDAVYWEIEDSVKQGGKNGPTVKAYKTALDVLSSKSDSEFNLLVVPGIRNSGVTNYAIDMVENRFDALYLMDIDQYDKDSELVTTEAQMVDAKMTAQTFAGLPYDSSFAAAYFPDVVINDPSLGGDIKVPPTVAVLGAFANNDALAHSWFAPAGFTRGAIDISSAATTFSTADLDVLYESKINPITSFPGSEFVVWGQKTLLKSASSLDRVNVRRLLIYIRRTVRAIALGFLFEPNRAETLEKFSAQINPFLQGIMDNQGLDRFKVKIDTETTTQIDVENNTLRGKIYVQPAKTAEFISIDFVVSNTL